MIIVYHSYWKLQESWLVEWLHSHTKKCLLLCHGKAPQGHSALFLGPVPEASSSRHFPTQQLTHTHTHPTAHPSKICLHGALFKFLELFPGDVAIIRAIQQGKNHACRAKIALTGHGRRFHASNIRERHHFNEER